MKKIKEYISLPALIMLILALICVIINVIAVLSVGFSDFFNYKISPFFRTVLAKITGIIPISFAEITIILLPLILGFIIYKGVKTFKKNGKEKIKFLFSILAIFAYIYSSFVLTFAAAYRGTKLEDKLQLDRHKLTGEELKYSTDLLLSELKELTPKIEFGEDNFSVMPYSFAELNDKLNDAYEKYAAKHDYISKLKSKVKFVMLSEPMTYTHISGVYTFFTGEANVNVNYPCYTFPYTMAHEMAHQRGIAREDEANFVAFLVCLESDDDYIRYSAILHIFEYLTGPYYREDKEGYKEMYKEIPKEILAEEKAFSDFFEKYRDTIISDVSDKVNDSYLQSQGQQEGTVSYGLVAELAVEYLIKYGI